MLVLDRQSLAHERIKFCFVLLFSVSEALLERLAKALVGQFECARLVKHRAHLTLVLGFIHDSFEEFEVV